MNDELELELPEKAHGHPGPATYVQIAVILAVITAIEVAAFYIGFLRPVLTPLLIILSVSKFALVALWFMHLRFDSKLYFWLFVGGIALAIAVFAAVLVATKGLFPS
jgi:caa(3)-type oxidase subunit IV